MKKLPAVILLVMLLTACSVTWTVVGKPTYYHDAEHKVSCWMFGGNSGGSISCLPDEQVYNP